VRQERSCCSSKERTARGSPGHENRLQTPRLIRCHTEALFFTLVSILYPRVDQEHARCTKLSSFTCRMIGTMGEPIESVPGEAFMGIGTNLVGIGVVSGHHGAR
jgi:hypothetical protein